MPKKYLLELIKIIYKKKKSRKLNAGLNDERRRHTSKSKKCIW